MRLFLSGADREMTPAELADLAELNASNPAGAVEADWSKWPATTSWPDDLASDWRWAPARLTLAELVEVEAQRLRDRRNRAGDLMAAALDDLARMVRALGADTPQDFEARRDVMGRDEPLPEREPELTSAGRWQ